MSLTLTWILALVVSLRVTVSAYYELRWKHERPHMPWECYLVVVKWVLSLVIVFLVSALMHSLTLESLTHALVD